jgi:glycosyltransferase involved in cell wall biosynthesis
MSEAPLVSIVTAFHNAEAFLREAIESVLAQHYEHWRLLLIDDGSRDGSSMVARQYAATHPDRIVYLEHVNHENRGAAASRNTGMRAATGQYVAILDADDVWLPHKLEQQVALLEAHQEAAMVCGASLYWHGWTGRPEDLARDAVADLGIESARVYEPPALLSLLYPLGSGGAPCPSNILLRRSMMDPDGGFEEHFRGHYQLYEDQAFLAKIYLTRRVVVTRELWDKYRIHAGSCVSSVVAAGQYDAVRQFFLAWLSDYLSKANCTDGSTLTALHSARAAYLPSLPIQGEVELPREGWSVRVSDGNTAQLTHTGRDGLRISMASAATAQHWDVQLNQARLQLLANTRYVFRCSVRADRRRTLGLGVALGSPPWTNLGLYRSLDVTSEWSEIREEFVAISSTEAGRVHFDLGGSSVAVEISSPVLATM